MNAQAVLDFLAQNEGNILAGVIASLIVLALQSIAITAATLISYLILLRYRLSRLWCFPSSNRIYLISGAIEQVSSGVRSVILAGPDSDAASSAIASLGMIYPKTEIRHVYSSNFSIDFAKDNICVIGGPINNSIAARLISLIEGKIAFDDNACLTVFDKTYTPRYADDDKTIADFGVVLQMPNPLFDDARVVAFMGCDTFGVLAAALTLSNRLEGRIAKRAIEHQLGLKRFFSRSSFVAVVSCDVLDNDIINIRAEDVHVF